MGRPGQKGTIREGQRQGTEVQGQLSLSWEDGRTVSEEQGGSGTCEPARVAEQVYLFFQFLTRYNIYSEVPKS